MSDTKVKLRPPYDAYQWNDGSWVAWDNTSRTHGGVSKSNEDAMEHARLINRSFAYQCETQEQADHFLKHEVKAYAIGEWGN